MPRSTLKVNRFTVMAMLQAARAQYLGLPRDAAYSWGLNRAIFFAAAKRGFRGASSGSGSSPESPHAPAAPEPTRELYRLGDDEAYRDPEAKELVFRIGDKDQTAAEFERQIASRFGSSDSFREAWEEAIGIVRGFDRPTLESRSRFYSEVYKPRRDDLVTRWTEEFPPKPINQSGSKPPRDTPAAR
jgi:hypothetical protein